MKIPKKIRIAGFDYEIKYVNDLNDGINMLSGQILFNKNEILLSTDTDISEQMLYQTFLHEVIHGIVKHYRLPIEDSQEEEIVDILADGFYQLLADNKF